MILCFRYYIAAHLGGRGSENPYQKNNVALVRTDIITKKFVIPPPI
jgi:hypothetical protein